MTNSAQTRLSFRIDFGSDFRLGPGKVELLETIAQTGSISAAGRAMGMSYRRAWLLVASLNQGFHGRVVDTAPGGNQGGGATLTALGLQVVAAYRHGEQVARRALAADLVTLERLVAPSRPARPRPRRKRG